jgi:hypothetical protein
MSFFIDFLSVELTRSCRSDCTTFFNGWWKKWFRRIFKWWWLKPKGKNFRHCWYSEKLNIKPDDLSKLFHYFVLPLYTSLQTTYRLSSRQERLALLVRGLETTAPIRYYLFAKIFQDFWALVLNYCRQGFCK